MMHIKEPLLLIGKSSHVAAAGFRSAYLSGITVNKNVLSASLNKTLSSFLPSIEFHDIFSGVEGQVD